MKSILLKAFCVSTVGVILAYLLIIVFVPLFGEKINPSAWVLGFAGPYIIGLPLGIYCFRQADRLNDAHQQLVDAHEELRRKSRLDHMTGLLNRETFLCRLEKWRRRSDNGYLLIADADHFKRINDGFGHQTGDKALLLISDAIRSAIRDDDVAGRIGGEEFGIFISKADSDTAQIVSERIRRAVENIELWTPCGNRLHLTISAGGASTADASNLSELMQRADRSLYDAKKSGRNRVTFDGQIREAA